MNKELKKIREEVDAVDRDIVKLVDIRMSLVLKTLKHKTKVLDTKREKDIFKNIKCVAKKSSFVSTELAEKLFKLILKSSKKLQKEHFKKWG